MDSTELKRKYLSGEISEAEFLTSMEGLKTGAGGTAKIEMSPVFRGGILLSPAQGALRFLDRDQLMKMMRSRQRSNRRGRMSQRQPEANKLRVHKMRAGSPPTRGKGGYFREWYHRSGLI